LAQAEETALSMTARNAGLADGQNILELGCGWGSLTLWMARNYPRSKITAISNSHSQRAAILARAQSQGLKNIDVITCDMNGFETSKTFDRIVSVEMFEHMRNWPALLWRMRKWMTADGRAFIHVFTHRTGAYAFDSSDPADWIGQHFFTGGIMPAHTLLSRLDCGFEVEQEWRWNGTHYKRTADAWLNNFDARQAEIMPVLKQTYGVDADIWRRRWRLFYLATSGLFGHARGEEWGVSHYRLKPLLV
ncbi:MAG: class I SAM-dependent methyltransferase, partial [Alphaproteobacteria bacterium]|nr:class I SAM-dependent methyltransferase [Alphaproteobacteria bacterium]